MMRGAAIFGTLVGGVVLAAGLTAPPIEALGPGLIPANCVRVQGSPSMALVCHEGMPTPERARPTLPPSGGVAERALSPSFAAAVRDAATMRLPLPTWLPAGVLRWEAEIHQAAAEAGLDPLALAILVSIECPSGNPNCGSYAGAVGLTQFMPGTADAVAARSGIPCWNRTDPVVSLRCGAYHFVELLSMCGDVWQEGQEADAIACAGSAYNAGPGYIPAMRRHILAGGDPRTAPIPAQTRQWVTLAMDRWHQAGRR